MAETSLAVQATEYCDLYGLRFLDISDVLLDFPELNHKLMQYAQLRRAAMLQLQGGSDSAKVVNPDDQSHRDAIGAAEKQRQMDTRLEALQVRDYTAAVH